jgi:hypothetical protein
MCLVLLTLEASLRCDQPRRVLDGVRIRDGSSRLVVSMQKELAKSIAADFEYAPMSIDGHGSEAPLVGCMEELCIAEEACKKKRLTAVTGDTCGWYMGGALPIAGKGRWCISEWCRLAVRFCRSRSCQGAAWHPLR